MTRWSCFVLLLWNYGLVGGIRILDLRVPAHAAEGGSALLGCQFDLEGDMLYSVKWYKDGREFFRFVPMSKEPLSYFPTQGVKVDIARSTSTVVALWNLTQKSAGVYRCEVSGEAPQFATVSDEKYITIHYLPKSSPSIMGLQEQYRIGDRLALNCSTPGSHPEAQLKWLVNERPVSRDHIRGPWYRISRERTSATETILELRFTVMPKHYKKGVLSIKCQAVIAPLYQEEIVHRIMWDDNAYSTIATPIESVEDKSFYQPPVYNEIKHLGFPPLDEVIPEDVTDNSVHQACLAHALVLILCIRIALL